ncbi:MAG TPA: Uma2 family endonuclease [Armatimonadota bacterium]|jgi:Uma2 family endonuclease
MIETIERPPNPEIPETNGAMPERRFTRAEYHRAAETGVFAPDERLELLWGRVVTKMSPMSSAHAMGIRAVAEALDEAFGEGFDIRQQLPAFAGEKSEPEPDICVLPGSWRDYPAHPQLNRAVLVVEIADTSLRFDRGIKAALYAEAGVRDYWVLNLTNRTLEVFRDPAPLPDTPSGFAYRTCTVYTTDLTVSPLERPDAVIPVQSLFPGE